MASTASRLTALERKGLVSVSMPPLVILITGIDPTLEQRTQIECAEAGGRMAICLYREN